ncbi:discoidin domain-containing protein [Paenibacillus sp. MWE-103]|uniref:Discoidin domain-containing protein n=2 Tax=Paenibacillus artemisiicola TaxID=1172618 RepID=A0ABS3W8I3_9BACL|nr:discoidin domain-containing protein [Paenibacillus artemisiicola]MBO7744630.1 discoidin domain-containing protein [Paenibacillus artemisiicola]
MNRAGQPIDIGFDDFADWRTAITAVSVNGTAVDAGKIHVAPGRITLDGSLFPKAGSYDVSIASKGFANTAVKQTIVTGSNVNLALRKPATTSDGAKQPGKYAVDGNKNTRWESDFSDPQFITVDLGAENVVSRVQLNWENAAGKSYTVDASADGKTWKTVYATTNGKPGPIDIGFLPVSARYVKVTGTERTTNYGYSLYDFEVYGDADGLPSAPELNADATDAAVGQPIVVTFDDDAAWRSAIAAVKLGGAALGAGQYAVSEGKLALNAALFAKAGAYTITVEAKDYADAVVRQPIADNNDPNQNPGQSPGQDPGQTNPNPLNLAFGRPTSSSPDYHRSSADAVDGRLDRRWESAFADHQWMSVDLGAAKTINRVVLNWENAYGKAYTIDVSEDGETWKTVYATENGNGGIDDLSFDPVSVRFVKMNGIARGTPYGFSLWELEVYAGDKAPLAGPALRADDADNVLGKPIELTFADDAAWRGAINAVELNGTALRADQYAVAAGKITLNAALFTEAKPYQATVQAAGYAGDSVMQAILPAANLALNKPAAASDNPLQGGERAVDGDKSTRWESAFGDPQWISVDLGSAQTVGRVLLNWENASAKAYAIEVSTDGEHWTKVYATSEGDGGIDNVFFAPVDARYVKVTGTQRNTPYGYSLFELEVYA